MEGCRETEEGGWDVGKEKLMIGGRRDWGQECRAREK